MSTQQILGVVGGVVGAFFGYPQLGFVVGSLVGGLLTPGEKTEGPRIDDLKVQVSTLGGGIAQLRGTERVGGNVVWSTDKIETSDTQGGKGGEPEHTTYRYFVHMGIALCETPRDGSIVSIVQIFQDGKLIYDARSGIPIGSALASAENPHAFFVLYQGHADQLPDPIEELEEGGPGTVPAYRGVVRIRMNAIECPGGRVPQFSFVLSTVASKVQEEEELFTGDGGNLAYGSSITSEGVWHLVSVSGGAPAVDVYYGSAGVATLKRRILLPYSGTGNYVYTRPIQGESSGLFFVDDSVSTTIHRVDFETGVTSEIATLAGPVADYAGNLGGASHDEANAHYVWTRLGAGDDAIYNETGLKLIDQAVIGDDLGPVAAYSNVLHAVTYDGATLTLRDVDLETGAVVRTVVGPTLTATIGASGIQVDANGVVVLVAAAPGSRLYRVTDLGWTLIGTATMSPSAGFITTSPTFYFSGTTAILADASSHTYTFIRFEALNIGTALVSDVIAEQCERAGETRFDVSEIPSSDTLIGYKLQNPASARSNIDPLLTAFAIYIVDEDGLIKFKKYEDIISQAEIAYDELGQAEDGSEPADAMPLNRAQEIDMPRSVTVSYIEPTFDYQTASEKEVRQITEATEDLIIEMPMATTSDHAKQVASMILYAKWRGQNTRSFKTSRKYAFLSSGDGVTVEYPRGTFRLWRITSMTDTGVLCEFNVEPGDAELYTQTAVGASGYVGQQVTPLAPPTEAAIVDGPIMRDADNNAGLYVAMEGYASGWNGAELLLGDNEASLESAGVVSNEATIGFAETALGNFTPNIVDETNLVTVNIGTGSLSSVTREVLLNGTENVAAIGINGRWEIIKFQRADSLGSGRYILSGLLRGLRGTEWAKGTHVAGDQFVLLGTAGTLRPNLDVGSLGQTKLYKAVSKGRSSSTASSQSYANTGEGLKPFSPVDLRKTITSNNITLTWGRRSRLSDSVLTTGAIPLGESVERYDVVIYSDATFTTIKRVIAAYSTSAVYTSVDQIADFGSNQTTLYVKVYQLSDSVGRGHELQATV